MTAVLERPQIDAEPRIHTGWCDANGQTWRDVGGFEGLYQVCPDGRVRSLDRLVPQGGRWRCTVANTHHGRVLKPYTTSSGRKRVVLHDKSHRRHARFVDELVVETFGVPA